ncbi:MAG: transglycosylase SLT domain-containing protein [bacterium]
MQAANLDPDGTWDRRVYTEDLDKIHERKVLRALVVYSPTDFFFADNGQPLGLQVELLEQYEKKLNKGIKRQEDKIRVRYIPTSYDRLLLDLEEGRGDIAAHYLTITPVREKRFNFATGKAMKVSELVVVHKDVKGIATVEDLAGREVYVLKDSSYVEHLKGLNKTLKAKGLKPVKIKQADAQLRSEEIMEMVNAGAAQITVIDDYKAKLWAELMSDVRVLMDVTINSDGFVGWAVRKNNPALHESLNIFAREVKKGSLMGNILFNRYYKSTRWIKNNISPAEHEKLMTLVHLFKRYAEEYRFDYLAIAAQAYQESQLNHATRSAAGAVGVMQLLPSTAADPNVGLPNIEDLEENIHAGVKYLRFLKDRYFSDPAISPEDQLAFAWAAYNAGPAKVSRMRNKAEQMGLDRNIWFNNVEMAAGKLVGRETVQYVSNIFKYYVAYALERERIDKNFSGSLKK